MKSVKRSVRDRREVGILMLSSHPGTTGRVVTSISSIPFEFPAPLPAPRVSSFELWICVKVAAHCTAERTRDSVRSTTSGAMRKVDCTVRTTLLAFSRSASMRASIPASSSAESEGRRASRASNELRMGEVTVTLPAITSLRLPHCLADRGRSSLPGGGGE